MSELKKNPKEKGVVFTAGPRKISVNELIRTTDSKVTNFVKNLNWDDSEKLEFMKAYLDLITSIDNGTIAERNLGRELIDTTSTFKNLVDGFDAYGYAAGFINSYADVLPEYKEEEVKKYHNGKSNRLLKAINDVYYGGNFTGSQADMELWRDRDVVGEDGVRPTTKRVEALLKIIDAEINDVKSKEYDYAGSPYRNREDLVERLERLSANLKNGIDTSDLNDFVAVGVPANIAKLLFENDLSKYFDGVEGSNKKELTELERKQKQLAELQAARKKEENLAATDKAIEQEIALQSFDDWYNNFAEGYDNFLFSRDNLDGTIKWYQDNTNEDNVSNMWDSILDNYFTYLEFLAESGVHPDVFQNTDGTDEAVYKFLAESGVHPDVFPSRDGVDEAIYKVLAGLKYFQPLIQDSLIDLQDGTYAIPAMEDYEKGTVGVWNPTTNELKIRNIKGIPLYKEILKSRYLNGYKHQRHIVNVTPKWYTNALEWVNKGIKKHQSGSDITRRWINANQNKPQPVVNQKTTNTDTTLTVDSDSDLKWEEITPMALDIISAGSAFIPGYGTLISGGTGLVSSIMQLAANKDGWLFVRNVGLDLIGMIPVFGSAAKAAKVYKGAQKILPILLQSAGYTAGALGALEDFGELGITAQKILNGEELSAKDWVVLAQSTADLLASGKNFKSGLDKAARVKEVSRLKHNEEFFVKRAGTNDPISKEEYEKIKKLEGKTVTDDNKSIIEELNLDTKEKGFGKNKETKVSSTTSSKKTGEFEFREIPILQENSKLKGNPYHLNWFELKYSTWGANYDKKPEVDVTKWKFPSDDIESNKNGGTIKYLRYLLNGGNDWKGTVMDDRSKKYLNLDNNTTNATNTGMWKNYYKMNEIHKDSLNDFKISTGSEIIDKLNHLESFNNKNFNPVLNELGYNDWNNAFHETGMNQYFGFDDKRFDYMGPTTYNRKAYYDWLKSQQNIETADGSVYFKDGTWTYKPKNNTFVTDTPVVTTPVATTPVASTLTEYLDPSKVSEKTTNNVFNPKGFNNTAGIIGNLIGVSRLSGILRDNKKASDLYARSIMSTNENFLHRKNPLFDPYSTRVGAMNRYAALVNNFEASANANDNMRERLAREMLGTNHVSEVNTKVDDLVRQLIASNYEKQHEIDRYNLGAANRNMARHIAAISATRLNEALLPLVQRASIDAFLKDKEKSFKEFSKSYSAYQLKDNATKALAHAKESPEYIALETALDAYKTWLKENPGGTQQDFFKKYPNHKSAYKNFNDLYNNNMDRVYNDYWKNQLFMAKSGGTVKAAKIKAKSKDSELLHKDIHQNLKNHIKLLNNLSNVTKRLILKAMDA